MDYDIANVNNMPVGLRKMCMVICHFAELYRTRPVWIGLRWWIYIYRCANF